VVVPADPEKKAVIHPSTNGDRLYVQSTVTRSEQAKLN
jgi:hypothetical protein